MPAAAVIPAPIAYIKVVAVKKLVVGFFRFNPLTHVCRLIESSCLGYLYFTVAYLTLRKLGCFKQAIALNTLAWNKKRR